MFDHEKITIEWANPDKNLILVTYHHPGWTWQDVELVFREQHRLIESVTSPRVDIMVNVTNSSWLPSGRPLLSVIKIMSNFMHPRQGCTVVVGAKGFLKALASSMMKLRSMSARDFHFEDTQQQGNKVLEEIRRLRTTSVAA